MYAEILFFIFQDRCDVLTDNTTWKTDYKDIIIEEIIEESNMFKETICYQPHTHTGITDRWYRSSESVSKLIQHLLLWWRTHRFLSDGLKMFGENTQSKSNTFNSLKFKKSQRKASGFISLTQGSGACLDYVCVCVCVRERERDNKMKSFNQCVKSLESFNI